MKTCAEIKENGERCEVTGNLNPRNGRCLWHDPERKAEAKLARTRGAHRANNKRPATGAKTLPASEVPEAPKTLEDCVAWGSWLAVAVTTGQIDAKTCREANTVIKVLSQSLASRDVERELAELRKEVEALRRPRAVA